MVSQNTNSDGLQYSKASSQQTTTDSLAETINTVPTAFPDQAQFPLQGIYRDDPNDDPKSVWQVGNDIYSAKGLRLMITLARPARGEYLGNFLRQYVDGDETMYYWVPNWKFRAADPNSKANFARTEFFNLCRLVMLTRPPSLKSQNSGQGGAGAQAGQGSQGAQAAQSSSTSTSTGGPGSGGHQPSPGQANVELQLSPEQTTQFMQFLAVPPTTQPTTTTEPH
jgi:hypothetical protein